MMRTEEQRTERHLRNLRRRFEFLKDTAKPDNFGAVGELTALKWALKLLSTDPRIQVTDVQRTTGIVAQLANDPRLCTLHADDNSTQQPFRSES